MKPFSSVSSSVSLHPCPFLSLLFLRFNLLSCTSSPPHLPSVHFLSFSLSGRHNVVLLLHLSVLFTLSLFFNFCLFLTSSHFLSHLKSFPLLIYRHLYFTRLSFLLFFSLSLVPSPLSLLSLRFLHPLFFLFLPSLFHQGYIISPKGQHFLLMSPRSADECTPSQPARPFHVIFC